MRAAAEGRELTVQESGGDYLDDRYPSRREFSENVRETDRAIAALRLDLETTKATLTHLPEDMRVLTGVVRSLESAIKAQAPAAPVATSSSADQAALAMHRLLEAFEKKNGGKWWTGPLLGALSIVIAFLGAHQFFGW